MRSDWDPNRWPAAEMILVVAAVITILVLTVGRVWP